jgi:hypothetical protein
VAILLAPRLSAVVHSSLDDILRTRMREEPFNAKSYPPCLARCRFFFHHLALSCTNCKPLRQRAAQGVDPGPPSTPFLTATS